jgi:hypothetical protein
MAFITKTRVKYVFAGIGAVYLVLMVGYLVYRGVTPGQKQGPSDLEANPDRQEEILARRRALELQQQLKLTDEQTDKIADIYQKNPER